MSATSSPEQSPSLWSTDTVRVACCQLAGRSVDRAAEALDAAARLVGVAAEQGASIIVLPEGTYPAYVVESVERARAAIEAGPPPLEFFGELAARHGVTLVSGLILPSDEEPGLTNSAVLHGPDGTVLSTTHKRFLWHFDHRWFAAGSESPVVATGVGPVGALICADARLPEIASSMARQGATLICDPTAWVATGREPETLGNIQPEFLLPARAAECGVAFAAASKVGPEGRAVQFVGRSMVIDHTGAVVAEATRTDEEVIVADVRLPRSPAPLVAESPSLRARLTAPASRYEEFTATAGRARVAVATVDPSDPDLGIVDLLTALDDHDTDLVVLPDLGSSNHSPSTLARLADEHGVWIAGASGLDRLGVLAAPGEVVARFELGAGSPPVVTPFGRVVVLVGPDGLRPEPARLAMLDGVELVAWCCGLDPDPSVAEVPPHRTLAKIGRARAAENRVFVAQSCALPDDGWAASQVVGPTGAVLAAGPIGRSFVSGADCLLTAAADKEMAPGTDVVSGRQPATY